MPAVEQPTKALVTGANGYLATWIVRHLLEKGFHVRGTVRTAEKGDVLARAFAEFEGRFEYEVVKDVLQVRPN